jgi:photosystem II stability/assembly factor-like uncharacterized protein
MKMKFYLLVFLAFTFNLFSQNYYTVISPFVESELNDVFLVNQDVGWIVGNKGIILYTSDGGQNWVRKSTLFNYDFLKVFFYDQDRGWIGTANGRIMITTNGGNDWTEVLISPDFTYFDAIYFTSPFVGHISVGKYKAVYIMRTTDGGLTWTKKDSLVSATTASRWYDIDFYNDNLGVVVGDKKDAQRYTTDGGQTWLKSTPINDNFFRDQRSVHWLNSTDVISLGEGNEFWGVVTPIYKSTDGGKNWAKKTQYPQNNYDRVRDAYFKNSLEGIAVGNNGFSFAYITRTTDGGETWNASFLTYSFGLKALAGFGNKLIALGTGAHILSSDDFGNNWQLYRQFTPTPVYAIQFVGSKGYALTRYSDFYFSEDAYGDEWIYRSSPPMWESVAMQFLDEYTGFILKENRHIVKTTDGGQSWRTVLDPVAFNARNRVGGISFPTNQIGYAWMSLNDYPEYYVYKTTDGGESWFQVKSLNGPGYISGNMAFFDENTGIIAGPQRWMMRTTNGGIDWDTVFNFHSFPSHLTKKDFKDIFIVNENKAWVVGIGFICYTTDKGLNWYYVNHNINGIDSSFYTVNFFGDTLGYVACYDGTILKTTDGGLTWTSDLSLKNSAIIFSSAINLNGRAFFGTSDGRLIATEKITSVKETKVEINQFDLSYNYPNPFNSSTRIRFTIPVDVKNPKNVKIEIFDLLGRKVTTIIDKQLSSGTYEVEFNLNNSSLSMSGENSSGVLFYRLMIDNRTITRKMIYLK